MSGKMETGSPEGWRAGIWAQGHILDRSGSGFGKRVWSWVGRSMLSWWPVSWRTQARVEGWPGSMMDCRVCACRPVCSRLVQMGLNGADVPYSPGIGRTRAELKVQKVSILV